MDRFLDRVAPTGRVLRSEAIYTSPTRHGLERWIAVKERRKVRRRRVPTGSMWSQFDDDTLVRHLELTLDDSLFVYDTVIYEELLTEAYEKGFDYDRVDASPYWESAVPVVEWLERFSDQTGEKATTSELLVAPRHIQQVKIESTGLTENFDPTHESLLVPSH